MARISLASCLVLATDGSINVDATFDKVTDSLSLNATQLVAEYKAEIAEKAVPEAILATFFDKEGKAYPGVRFTTEKLVDRMCAHFEITDIQGWKDMTTQVTAFIGANKEYTDSKTGDVVNAGALFTVARGRGDAAGIGVNPKRAKRA